MNRQQIKKWSLLRHLNFKGYKRTASGNPLNMVKVMFPSQLTIYGNAVQDGTPSPDAPVEVQLCGDRTGNLLSMRNVSASNIPVKSYNNGIIEVIGNSNYSGGRTTRLSEYITLEANQTYTLALYLVSGKVDSSINACLSRRENGNFYYGGTFSVAKRVMIITPDENVEVYLGLNLSQGDYNSTLRVAIYKGSYTVDTLPAYEPYGYKVSGRAEGINLLDYTKATDRLGNPLTIIDDGVIWDKMIDYYFYIPCDIKAGTKICFSCKSDYPENEGNSIVAFSIRYTDGTYDYSGLGCFTPTKDVKTFCPRKNHPDDTSTVPIKITDIMLVAGDYTPQTMPPYEPYQAPQDFAVYLPEQIAKVGDVADEVVVDMERKTAELVRRIERNEFKGTDAWKNDWFPAIVKNLPETAPAIPSARCVSNHFDHNGDTSVPITQIANVFGTTISVARANLISGVTDAETFKTWLSDKNVYAYYPLAEPVTTDITSLQQWDAMPNIEGTVSITFDSTIPISNAEAEYHSKEYDAT